MKLHPLLKGLIFAAVVPGSAVGWVPWLIRRRWPMELPVDVGGLGSIGIPLIVIGAAIYLWCAWDFAMSGRGTPAAFDPPVRLVVRGLYKCVRNPMYVGLLTLLMGQAILLNSLATVLYAMAAGFIFHLFILLHEEPHLTRQFGDEYERYSKNVNRWIPNCKVSETKKTARREPF